MEDNNRFWITDAKLNIFTHPEEAENLYRALRDLLRGQGFTCRQDPETRKRNRRFPSICQKHHVGNKSDLYFYSNTMGYACEFQFYEDVVRDNPNGGRHHFDKLQKMPYLRRLKTILILRKMAHYLRSLGFHDRTKTTPRDSLHQVEIRRNEWMSSHGESFYDVDRRYAYNTTDADGVAMNDGDVRCIRSSNGHLIRGRVFYSANNMWMMVVNRDQIEYTHSGAFFTHKTNTPRKLSLEPRTNIGKALVRRLQAGDYLRAHQIQQAIRRKFGMYEFKAGDKVCVDNARYRGEGEVRYLKDGGTILGVMIENGNTWEYESSTAKPIDLVQV